MMTSGSCLEPIKAYSIIQNEPIRWNTDFEWELTEMDYELAGHMSALF